MVSPGADGDTLWIRRFGPFGNSRWRLFCFPHAGGSASYFFPLSRLLAPDVEVAAVQYPGRQDRRSESCIETIPELAENISQIVPDWMDLPFGFFGHSMGAVVAFEVAQLLERRLSVGPARLFASGRRAPSRLRDERVRKKSDQELMAELRRLGGTSLAFMQDQELMAMVLPVVRADYRAIETYGYTDGSLSCPITVLIGDSDPRASVDEASAWRDHTTGDFDLQIFSGGHFYLESHQAPIANLISSALQMAEHENARRM